MAGTAYKGGDVVYGQELSGTGYAGFFLHNVDVDGNLSKAGGSFKIDHPLDLFGFEPRRSRHFSIH